MIGVTSFHKPDTPSRPDSGKKDAKVIPKTGQVESEPYSPTLEKSLEAALLIEMAKRGIELPLSPKTPIPIATELEKAASANFATAETSEDSEVKPYQPQTPKKPESRKSSAKSSASSKRSKIPSTSQSRVGSAKKQISQIDEQDKEPDVFVPQGAKAIYQTKRILRRSGGAGGVNELVPSTDESDPEVAFFKKLDRIKQDSRNYPAHPYRKYSRRRKPERTLSSISEKSAEIAAEAALDYPQDTSISCPATTRYDLNILVNFKKLIIRLFAELSWNPGFLWLQDTFSNVKLLKQVKKHQMWICHDYHLRDMHHQLSARQKFQMFLCSDPWRTCTS